MNTPIHSSTSHSPSGERDDLELPTAEEVLLDPSTSFWLASTLESALARDPVDALNDALVLAAVLEQHLRDVLGIDERLGGD